VGIYKVPMTYKNIETVESTVSLKIGVSNVEISISPIPETNKALISIIEEGSPLIMNRVCSINEFIMEKYVFPSGFVGDFVFLFSTEDAFEFDITRFGDDLFLLYMDGEDYEV